MADATRRVSVRLSLDDAARVKTELRSVGQSGQRAMEQIRDSADRASLALRLIDVAAGSIAFGSVVAGLRQVVLAGDALTTSMGRLATAVGSVQRASEVYAALYRDALQTGVAVAESVDAFQRFAIAAREIGATNDQVLRLVAGLQRIAIASGAGGAEIQGSTLQLAQALASGVLQGDELRSILEGLPTLAQGLARELGVSIGELRKLGSEGKLTADVVFPALLRAVERVNTEFERAPLTVSRAYGQLSAAADQFLARLDQAIGLSNTLARALSGAARALDAARQGVGLLTDGERLVEQRQQLQALGDQIARLEAQGTGPAISAPVRRGSLRPGLVGTAQQQAGVDRAGQLAELRQQYFGLLAEVEEAERASVLRRLEEQEQAGQRAAEARRRRGVEEAEDLRRSLDDRFRVNQEYETRMRRIRQAAEAGAIDAAERQRLEALATNDRSEALRRLDGTARQARDAERDLNELLRDRQRLVEGNETAYEQYQRRLTDLAALAERVERAANSPAGRRAGLTPIPDETIAREAQAAAEELRRADERLAAASATTSEVARELGLTFASAFEDAIVKGESLRTVLKGIESDLARIIVRRAITEPLANAVGGLNLGNVFGSFFSGLFGGAGGGSVPAGGGNPNLSFGGPRAAGGPVALGSWYLVGERGPEPFIPTVPGQILPTESLRGMGGGGTSVVQHITVDARGADAGVDQKIRAAVAIGMEQANARLLAQINRGGAVAKTVGRRA